MEFEELQKIWDTQNNQPLYALNEKAMYNRILSKKKKAYHIANISELLLIVVYIGAGSFILGVNLFNQSESVFMYLLSVWMFGSALYSLVSRIRRIKGNRRFDRSMRGDLEHAISIATYQVRLSWIMRWNTLPIAALTILGVWQSGTPLWVVALLLIFFVLGNYASGWEHNIYIARKRELEILQTKLADEAPGNNHSS